MFYNAKGKILRTPVSYSIDSNFMKMAKAADLNIFKCIGVGFL